MVLDEWSTGDIATAINFNKRTVRRGTTTEIDNISDSLVTIGDLFFDTTLVKPKFCTEVVARKYHVLSPVGTQHQWVPAAACYPAVTDPCGVLQQSEFGTNDVDIETLDFAGITTDEIAKFDWTPPQAWDAGTIKCKPYWTAVAGAGTVEFEFSGLSLKNDDAMDIAFGTAQPSVFTFTAADDLHIGPQTAAITLSGTPQVTEFSWIQIKIQRDQVNDTKTEDAKLIGFVLEYTIVLPTSVG